MLKGESRARIGGGILLLESGFSAEGLAMGDEGRERDRAHLFSAK